jgi:hypothetical protein
VARRGGHRGAQTAIGPSQSPSRSLETARRGTCLRPGAKVSGSQTDLLTPLHDGRAEIIPFRYLPVLLGGQGTSHVGRLPSRGKKLRGSNPTRPMCSPRRNACGASLTPSGWHALRAGVWHRRRRVVSSRRSACGACTKLPQPRVHLCQPTLDFGVAWASGTSE